MDTKTRILLIDDDADLGSMLTEYLAGEGFETTTILNGDTGAEAALSGAYDAVILDVMLPGLGGVEVLRRVRQASRIPIIMLTAKGDHVDRIVGLEMGADDYVPKPCYPRELVARLRAVLRRMADAGERPPGETLVQGKLKLLPPQRKVSWDGKPLDLTVSEFNLLEILLHEGDRVVSKDELSERALGRPREPYDRSVDVHVSNLRQKLHAAAGDEICIETVRGIGYRVRRS
ncbi:response regulator transcription factor [Desulfocurvibacter africanus]|uniref:Two component transcriptional regulator, winged helix family n=1 Tax=Desulfocurvibacter africanus subsp. africanus str. Walvis Bay TaxID=690850 RepID=F3Z393_DESAF|nr:response regulator transcription factor [Desulfocurvibacter africanus]EGJ50337.1 two component transcriptional regulator, winged helix family [Desulfocurvibacter africanus subsp. africanus str. Walvis Bay]